MFQIGEFSKMCKTTVKTLRYYDEIGILKPEKIDKFTGYRFYSTNQLVELHKIQSYRQIGLSIDEIKQIFYGDDHERFLEKRRSDIILEINQKQIQLSRIEFMLKGREDNSFMNYVAAIKEIPEYIVYSKKLTVPNYESYMDVIPPIGKEVLDKYPDIKCAVPEYCIVIYLDGEYREKDFNIEFCEAVDSLKPDFNDIKFKKMESVTAVSVIHKGPYTDLPKAYAFAFKWIEENNYSASDHPRESYIDGIWNKENEKDWLTELQIPIIKNN